jgi:hypothetical protein
MAPLVAAISSSPPSYTLQSAILLSIFCKPRQLQLRKIIVIYEFYTIMGANVKKTGSPAADGEEILRGRDM